MPFGPQIAMSGAFHFEAPNGASPVSGVHAGVFRPPMSPSASSYLTKSTGSLMSDASTPATYVNRKRQRPGEATPTHNNGVMNGEQIFRWSSSQHKRMDGVPLPLMPVGGVVGKVWEFCKTGAFRGFYGGGGRAFDAQANPLPGNEQTYQTPAEYDHGAAPGGFPDSDYAPFYYEHDTPDTTPPPAAKRRQISAGMPNDELRKNWVMVNEAAETPTPPVQLSRPALQSRPSLPRRISKPVSRLSPAMNRRHSGRISHAGSSSINCREPASFASALASPRTSLSLSMAPPERPSTPSRLPVAVRQPQSPALFSPSPRQSRIPSPSPHMQRGSHRRNHSAASAASVGSMATPATVGKVAPMSSGKRRETLGEGNNSPRLDPEVQHMVARRQREERAADARINDFNARLQEMIRQGKEALGTTIEVDGDMDYTGGGAADHWEDEY
ncbi:hypothetical protein PG987_011713 [Apiospora arundinis]